MILYIIICYDSIVERNEKMKKLISAILVLCMMLSFAACSGDDEIPDGMKNVASDKDAYYLYVPQSWVDNNNGVVGAYYSAIDRSNISVTAYSGEEFVSSEEYWDSFKADIDNIASEFEVIKENEPKVIGGKNAIQHTYKMTVSGVKYKVQQMLVAYSNIMYVVTYTAAEDRFDAHTEDIQRIIDEFKFK